MKARLKRLVGVHRHGRQYTPRLWSVFISVPVALVAAAVAAWLIYNALFGSSLVRGATAIDVTKTALTIMAGLGAVLAGVYAYRKQRLEEGASHRADADQFTGRYNSAADQLGSARAAIRLAGVYAMARLADDWKDQRQVCVDVLCAYLRMPQLDPDPGEDQVHQTITRLIVAHLQAEARVSWSSLNFDLTGVIFKGPVSFEWAIFSGKSTSFSGATFSGKSTSFSGATFSGESTSFDEATFSGESTNFQQTTFSGESTSFERATFSGKSTVFFARFSGESTSFDEAMFSGELTIFYKTTFSGRLTSFDRTTFSSQSTSFDLTTFSGQSTSFFRATFSGTSTSFTETTFSAESTSFIQATFSAESTSFFAATFSGTSASFKETTFSGTSSRFDRATFSDGLTNPSSVQMDSIRLINGASVTRDGLDFRGWPPPNTTSPAAVGR